MTTHVPTSRVEGAELPRQYRPADHEARIWRAWEEARVFHADPGRVLSGEARPWSILIPPPNVTDRLHLGHALNNTLQDILVRARRMMGFETLWMPGTDHAGIATQAVVERRVWKEEKKRRADFTRDQFVARIQAFKDEYEAVITGQLKALGCSCDWERRRFTMDEQCARAVRQAFFRLFRDGLIYRGKRLVNWDPVLQTAVADDECYDEEIDGAFYYLRYPLVHPHGPTTRGERRRGELPPADAVPVTWSELEARGYPGAEQHPPEEQAWVTVATTRPETYLGDTAVAVNPRDPRAKPLHGLCVELPLVGRIIPIIEDSYVVLPRALASDEEARDDPKAEFATGFLKVTPAHDPNDFEIYQRHKERLDTFAGRPGGGLVNVMAPDASISDRHGWHDVGDAHIFVGKKREEARRLVVKEFEARGLLEGTRPCRHAVRHSDRSKAAIEPYLSDQWYCRVTDPRLAGAANAALAPDQRESAAGPPQDTADRAQARTFLRFHPARYARTYETWHENIRDWCISRQLWWGHRIPVWHRRLTIRKGDHPQAGEFGAWGLDHLLRGEYPHGAIRIHDAAGREVPPTDLLRSDPHADRTCDVFICYDGHDPRDELRIEQAGFVRDPDVLDTWFSSALWPVSTMGWPDDTPLLRAFHPTDALCTARDIITLWVSRMVMFNRYLMPAGWGPHAPPLTDHYAGPGPAPFRDVYIHALILDGEGQRMSKSKGNGVDPLDIINSHGADALRFTLCQLSTQTQDVRLPVQRDPATGRNTSPRFDLGRNFCNKIWNAARFALGILARPESGRPQPTLVDRWMLSRLAESTRQASDALDAFEFSVYAQTLYDLLWRDFCDWYLEAVKPTIDSNPFQRSVLAHALETIVRLLHPVTPFVTEAIWERLRDIETAPIEGVTLDPPRRGGLLCTAGWPVIADSLRDESAQRDFARLRELISSIRELRARHDVPEKRRVTLHLPRPVHDSLASLGMDLVRHLGGVGSITTSPPTGPSVIFTFESGECRLSDLADAIDPAAERARLLKVIADLRKTIDTLETRLGNPGYTEKAPPAMVRQTREQLARARDDFAAAKAALDALGAS
jgi:valyl-tRNA synthetase